MRGLAIFLVAGLLVVSGCGSSSNSSSPPKSQAAATSGGAAGQSAAVAAGAPVTAGSLCTAEGKGKSHKQCVSGLGKLNNGQAKNPAGACKKLSKKKTKGVKGKSPYAVCVAGAAKLMAAKNNSRGNGSSGKSGKSGSSGNSGDTSTDSTDSTDTSTDSTDSTDGLICTDANGDQVSPDDPNVEDCTDASDPNAGASDSTDTSTDSTDSNP